MDIDRRELLRRMMAPGVKPVLLDVLSPESYADGHLPGAVHLPFAALVEQVSRVLPDREVEIIAYCAGPT